jgi:hypothetical protein
MLRLDSQVVSSRWRAKLSQLVPFWSMEVIVRYIEIGLLSLELDSGQLQLIEAIWHVTHD